MAWCKQHYNFDHLNDVDNPSMMWVGTPSWPCKFIQYLFWLTAIKQALNALPHKAYFWLSFSMYTHHTQHHCITYNGCQISHSTASMCEFGCLILFGLELYNCICSIYFDKTRTWFGLIMIFLRILNLKKVFQCRYINWSGCSPPMKLKTCNVVSLPHTIWFVNSVTVTWKVYGHRWQIEIPLS